MTHTHNKIKSDTRSDCSQKPHPNQCSPHLWGAQKLIELIAVGETVQTEERMMSEHTRGWVTVKSRGCCTSCVNE
jgi:hypothetical protein